MTDPSPPLVEFTTADGITVRLRQQTIGPLYAELVLPGGRIRRAHPYPGGIPVAELERRLRAWEERRAERLAGVATREPAETLRPAAPAGPRIDTSVPGRVYLVDAAGARWRVRDCAWRDGKPQPLRLRDPRARYRTFEADTGGPARVVELVEKGDRDLEAGLLARQLAASGVLAHARPNEGVTHGGVDGGRPEG